MAMRKSYANTFDEDPFPDPDLMQANDTSCDSMEHAVIESMAKRAVNNGLPEQYIKELSAFVCAFEHLQHAPLVHTGYG